jgi:hypothetical protein
MRVIPQRTQISRSHFLAAARIFVTRHQTLGGAMPRTHGGLFNFHSTRAQPLRRAGVLC